MYYIILSSICGYLLLLFHFFVQSVQNEIKLYVFLSIGLYIENKNMELLFYKKG